MSLRRRHEEIETLAARELVGESEAFLSGTLVDFLVERRAPIPAWAWVNVLAHGDLAMITARDTRRVTRRLPPRDPNVRFAAAEILLIAEVHAAVHDDPDALSALQRGALVPLEFELMARTADTPCTPTDLVRAIRVAVGDDSA
jgi:hypothetical protein